MSQDPRLVWTFEKPGTKTIDATIVGFSGGSGGCQLLIQDSNVVDAQGHTKIDMTGNALSFIAEQNIPNAALYEMSGNGPSYPWKITPRTIRATAGAVTNLTFIHVATAAYVTIGVKVLFNKDIRQTIASSKIQG